jgi:glycerophosphoryl diester phosphodiesterase
MVRAMHRARTVELPGGLRFVFVLVWSLTCVATAQAMPLEIHLRGGKIGAHRGGYWSLSQSSLRDFAASLKSGTDILEIDLRSTSDGGVVVYHSDTLSKHTFCFGLVRHRTFEDVTHCRLLPTGDRIPGFEKVLRWTRGKNVILNAEFKDEAVIEPTLALVDRYDAWDRIYFQANAHYDRYTLARQRSARADILVNAGDMDTLRWAVALDDRHLIIGLREPVQTPEAVALVHQYGRLASANSWRPSEYEELLTAGCDRLFAMGVDIVITNNVQSCIAQRAARWAMERDAKPQASAE